ncbi:uncharacterized protein HKW66_Vig0039520 [Vigna angularis]|uniref:DUF4283 domain-containing protein n=1 Tax=Phaseolus angularis TaxID=3914 RepID=A0A8T0L8D7_PHAAN|nr:uncharacterized protein HKW66_Vig0039520 [Vigna angularis]
MMSKEHKFSDDKRRKVQGWLSKLLWELALLEWAITVSHSVEISDYDDVEVCVKVVVLMHCEDLKVRLHSMGDEVAASIVFDLRIHDSAAEVLLRKKKDVFSYGVRIRLRYRVRRKLSVVFDYASLYSVPGVVGEEVDRSTPVGSSSSALHNESLGSEMESSFVSPVSRIVSLKRILSREKKESVSGWWWEGVAPQPPS